MPAAALAALGCACSGGAGRDRKSTRLNSSHTEIYTLSLHDALPIFHSQANVWYSTNRLAIGYACCGIGGIGMCLLWWRWSRSEEHTSELQSHRDLHSFPTRRSSDLSFPS